jgi:hypothetical protein
MVNDVDGWELENLVPCSCAVEVSLSASLLPNVTASN